GPELGAHFRLHQRLAQHAHPFAQEIHILIHPDLAQGSQQVDTLPRGHRVPSFSVSVHTLRRTTRWPSPSTALALTHSLGFYPRTPTVAQNQTGQGEITCEGARTTSICRSRSAA